MIEVHRNMIITLVSDGEEEKVECEKVIIQWLTNKNKRVEVHIRAILKDEKQEK